MLQAMQLHLKECHQYNLVSEGGKDWAVSEDLKSKLEVLHLHNHIHQPLISRKLIHRKEPIYEVTFHFATSDFFCCHLDSKTLCTINENTYVCDSATTLLNKCSPVLYTSTLFEDEARHEAENLRPRRG